MKSICFESYRAAKRDKIRTRPKPQTLDPSWYTDNIYSNRSIDLEEDYIPDCLKYNTYRKLRDINENDTYDNFPTTDHDRDRYILQRSKSCKEFKYPKSRSCCFGGYDLKPKPSVPKSYSFSVNRTKTKPFDVIDYEPQPPQSSQTIRKDKKTGRKSNPEFYCHDLHSRTARCCSRDRCTNSKCFLDEIYNCNRKNNRDRHPYNGRRNNIFVDWEDRKSRCKYQENCDEYCCHRTMITKRKARYTEDECPVKDYPTCFDDGQQCTSEQHFHIRDSFDSDLNRFIQDERSRLVMQDKFLDDDETYLHTNYQPTRNKTMLEVKAPNKYDEDTVSDSTEMDLEDFNFDFEKYREKLDKPPSPIDLDMQQKNMNKNMKVKNVNVGRYNNGSPIDVHQREQERMIIKKNLLDGMPSPPQQNNDEHNYNYYDQTGSPFHRYSHKVYPEATPIYKYNNFYPHDNLHANHNSNNTISLINNIFSIYKPNKYSPLNCQQLNDHKPEPCKKMNVSSTTRPLGAPHDEYMTSMKRPLIVSTEQPHFKIIPEKTGLKISPLYRFDFSDKKKHKLKSTARPLLFPH